MSTKKIPESLQKIDTKDDDDNNKEQLWHIIEKQRTVIYELQKALFEITKERDQLLEKLHEENTIPTPPPRSPYRSTMSENSYTHIEIPPKTNNNKLHQQRKSMSDLLLHGDEQEKVKQLPGITKQQQQNNKYSKDGYLTKREKQSGWSKYYFVLKGNQLKYFQLPNLIGNRYIQITLDTQIGTRKPQPNEATSFKYAFVIMNKNEAPIILCADTDNERDQWVKTILSRITFLHEQRIAVKKRETFLKHHRSMPNTTESYQRTSSKSSIDSLPNIKHNTAITQISTSNSSSSISSSSSSLSNTSSILSLFQLFGVSLEEALRVSCKNQLPTIVFRCLEYLEAKDAIYEEGLYRVSGSSVQINQLRQQFCEFGDVDLLLNCDIVDVHVVSCLLKMWLRELPDPIISQNFIVKLQQQADMKEPLGPLVKQQLPEANYHLLLTLIGHLRLIVEYAEFNKMTLRNIAIIFAPTLSIPSGLFNLLMTEYESSFHLTVQPTTSADRFKQNYLKRKKNKSYFQ